MGKLVGAAPSAAGGALRRRAEPGARQADASAIGGRGVSANFTFILAARELRDRHERDQRIHTESRDVRACKVHARETPDQVGVGEGSLRVLNIDYLINQSIIQQSALAAPGTRAAMRRWEPIHSRAALGCNIRNNVRTALESRLAGRRGFWGSSDLIKNFIYR